MIKYNTYYQDILGLLPSKFKFSNVIEDLILQLLENKDMDKAAGKDNPSGKFLKGRANILAKSISEIRSLSIKYSLFPTDCQIAKLIFWFKSYLSNRKFKVILNQTIREPGNISCRVPQGSIIGSLIFVLDINYMPQALKCKLLSYVDDSFLIFQNNDINEIEI